MTTGMAAEELVRAIDSLLILQQAGKATDADVQRVREAERAYEKGTAR